MGATKEFAASVCFVFAAVVCVVGQGNGSLKGVTRDTAGANVAGVEIVFTNQVTSEAKTIRRRREWDLFDPTANRRVSSYGPTSLRSEV